MTRDPIGYSGGLNLYGYASGNPIGDTDPDGERPVSDADRKRLWGLYSFFNKHNGEPEKRFSLSELNSAVNGIEREINIREAKDPGLKALFYAIDHLGSTRWKPIGSQNHCNQFVFDSYAAANIQLIRHQGFNATAASTRELGTRRIPGFKLSRTGDIGNLALFLDPPSWTDWIPGRGGGGGHSTLYLGGGLYIYAGPDMVRIGNLSYVMNNPTHLPPVYQGLRVHWDY